MEGLFDNILSAGSKIADLGFTLRSQQVQLATAKAQADAQMLAQQNAKRAIDLQESGTAKFAKWALMIALGLAGLAILAEARKLYRGAR